MKHTIALLIGLLLGPIVLAQNSLDILTISGRYGFPQSYDSLLSGKATETGIFVGLTVPVVLSKKTIWYNSLNYFYFHVRNEPELPVSIANPINLHGFILRTGLYQKFDQGRALQLLFAPRLMSDLVSIDGKSFQFGGLALYEKVFSDKLGMSFGAMYNQELFGPYLVPLININWQVSDKWLISGLLPIYAKISYKVNEKFNFGISHFGLLTTYSLNDPEYKDDYIERQSIDLSLYGRYKLAGNFYIEARFGRSFSRSYAQYAGDQKVDFAIPLAKFGDDRVQKNINFHDGFIGDLRIVYNIPIPEDE
jgi:hypothetical protein